jgi:hypothetical protein
MTGTPLDLTPFGGAVKAIGWLYWIAAFTCVVLALWWLKRWWLKLGVVAAILAVFVLPATRHVQEKQQQYDVAKTALDRAMAHFEMRCKDAGEKIKRTVDNVEGVVWMKWREPYSADDDADQFKLNDPFGRDCYADECIEQLLTLENRSGRFEQEVNLRKGRYRFVESIDRGDGKRYRYTGTMKPVPSWTTEAIEKYRRETGSDIPDFSYKFALAKMPIDKFAARYGITWDDISAREDREMWIAGGSIKVIDLQSNEVIAERVGYLIDTGQGSQGGFRSPWGWAKTYAPRCPRTSESTQAFAIKVLKPSN